MLKCAKYCVRIWVSVGEEELKYLIIQQHLFLLKHWRKIVWKIFQRSGNVGRKSWNFKKSEE